MISAIYLAVISWVGKHVSPAVEVIVWSGLFLGIAKTIILQVWTASLLVLQYNPELKWAARNWVARNWAARNRESSPRRHARCASSVSAFRVTCQSPLLTAPPTKSPLKSGRRWKGRKFKSPPRQVPPKITPTHKSPLRDYAVLRILQFWTDFYRMKPSGARYCQGKLSICPL